MNPTATSSGLGIDQFIQNNPGVSMAILFGVLSFAAIGMFSAGTGAHRVVTSSKTRKRVRDTASTGGTLLIGAAVLAGGYLAYQYFANQGQ